MVDSSDSAGTTTVLYVIVVVVAVLVGTVLAPVTWGIAAQMTSEPQPSEVAVITLSGTITGTTAQPVIEDLREARRNESVEAVVLKVNSPGGGAAASEQLYMAVNRTAAEMTVVAAVTGVAASGAYYAIAPADRIYVTPATIVGSVGAYASVGVSPEQVPGNIIRSGPDKATQTIDQVKDQLEIIQRSFVSTIMKHRGDELTISRTELAHAKVYTGVTGIKKGVADRIGSVNTAINYAASQENLDEYVVRYKEPPIQSQGIILSQTGDGRVVVDDDAFGYDNVDTTTFFALWGVPQTEQNEVIVNATG